MRNTFNLLLISMIAFDSWYLLGSILENFRRNFGLGSQLHTILFPKFLYPAMSVAMSGSIFMTVAISLERYFAVHHPIGKLNLMFVDVQYLTACQKCGKVCQAFGLREIKAISYYFTNLLIQRSCAHGDLEKTVLHEICVNGTVLWSPTNANSPTYTYISQKPC